MNEKAERLKQHLVKHRNFTFDDSQDLSSGIPNDPFRLHWLNAFSTMFPAGEKIFIESVRFFKNDIKDDILKRNIKEFIQQEANHSKEHNIYNENLKNYSIDIDYLSNKMKIKYDWLYKHTSPLTRLSITVAAEHLTAMFAEGVLRYKWLKNAKPEFASLWEWHCVEEIDHKSVAFDVYQCVCGNYFRRMLGLFYVNIFVLGRVMVRTIYLLKHQHLLLKWNTWTTMIPFVFGIHGVIHQMLLKPFFQYLNPNFHPWNKDDTDLIRKWESENNSAT